MVVAWFNILPRQVLGPVTSNIWEKLCERTDSENDAVNGFAACAQCHKLLAFDSCQIIEEIYLKTAEAQLQL